MIFIKDKDQFIKALVGFDEKIVAMACDGLIGLGRSLSTFGEMNVLYRNDLIIASKITEQLICITNSLGMLNEDSIIIAENLNDSLSIIYSPLEVEHIEYLDRQIDDLEKTSSILLGLVKRLSGSGSKESKIRQSIEAYVIRTEQAKGQYVATRRDNRNVISRIIKDSDANWYKQFSNIEMNFANALNMFKESLWNVKN